MATLQHAAVDVLFGAIEVLLFHAIVATIAVPCAFHVLLVALLRRFARWAPEQFALIVARATGTLVAACLAIGTQIGVAFEVITGTEFRYASTIFRQIAFSFGATAHHTCLMWMTCLQITAFSRRTRGIRA